MKEMQIKVLLRSTEAKIAHMTFAIWVSARPADNLNIVIECSFFHWAKTEWIACSFTGTQLYRSYLSLWRCFHMANNDRSAEFVNLNSDFRSFVSKPKSIFNDSKRGWKDQPRMGNHEKLNFARVFPRNRTAHFRWFILSCWFRWWTL